MTNAERFLLRAIAEVVAKLLLLIPHSMDGDPPQAAIRELARRVKEDAEQE